MVYAPKVIIDIFCPKCGRKGDLDANYCFVCGIALERRVYCRRCGSTYDESQYKRCPRCMHIAKEGGTYCGKCGAFLEVRICCSTCGADFRIKDSKAKTRKDRAIVDDRNAEMMKFQSSAGRFFHKLANGDFGLAQTFWLYGVLVSISFRFLVAVVPSMVVIVILNLIWIAYSIPLCLGTWRAATKYTGPKVWEIFAKILVGLGVIALLWMIIGLLADLGE